jgi:hypothetical protein
MALIQTDSQNPHRDLIPADYKADGTLNNVDAEVALVVGSASRAEQYIQGKQYALLWRDSDMLFQSPRPISVFEHLNIMGATYRNVRL